jgi:hypothetical protein
MNDVWQFLSDAATFFANIWSWVVYGWRWLNGPAATELATVPWLRYWDATVYFLRGFVGLATLISAIMTIIGVRYYFRQNNTYSLNKRFEALLEIKGLAVELKGEIDELHNADGINAARKDLIRTLISTEFLFDDQTKSLFSRYRAELNELVKKLRRLDVKLDAEVTQRMQASTEYQSCHREASAKIENFKNMVDAQSATIVKAIDKAQSVKI